jgi:portal protein
LLVTLEMVPWRGDNVPLLSSNGNGVSRAGMTDYLSWLESSFRYGGNLYPTMTQGVTVTQNGKQAEPVANNFIGYVQGLFYTDGPVAAVEWKRVEVFSQAPLLFQKRRDGRPGDLYDDESLDLIRAPWVGGTTSDLQARSLLYADLGGSAYVVVIDDELVVLRPDYVEIVLEPRMWNGSQVGWRQVAITYTEGGPAAGSPAVFMRGEYAHFAPKPDPLASYRGMSWLTPVIREVQADKQASEHKTAYFENAASPNLAVSVPQQMTPDQFREFVDAMDSAHRGVQHAGKTLYTAGGADVTVIGSNMQQMDFAAVQGKGETRVANAGGIHPAIVGFSEGMAGSSMNAGNYQAAKRQTVDTTFRHLWSNWCGSLQQLFPPPEASARLWYDIRDIPFLHDDAKDLASVQQTQASVITTYTREGFVPDSAIAAVRNDDISLLKHTGLTSVQLTPPSEGETPTEEPVDVTEPAAETEAESFEPVSLDGDEEARAAVWLLDQLEISRREEVASRSYRYRHGWIPASPLALLSPDVVDDEYGRELDSVEFGDRGRIVARQHGVTVESDSGSDIAIHATPSTEDAGRWADAIDSGQPFSRPTFAAEPHPGGVAVRFGDHEADLTDAEARDVAQALRDMAYVAEDREPEDSETHLDDFAEEARAWVWDLDGDGMLDPRGVLTLARRLGWTDVPLWPGGVRWIRRNVTDHLGHVHGADGKFIRKLLGHEEPTDPNSMATHRVVAHSGSVVHVRLKPRKVRVDDRVYNPNGKGMGTVLTIHPDTQTMRVRWDEGRVEERPLASITDPIPEPTRRYAATPPDPLRRMDDDMPTRRRTAREKLADKVAAGQLGAEEGARLAAGESPTSIVDSRSPEGFREAETAKLPADARSAVEELDPEKRELYWLRRTAGQSHTEALNGLAGKVTTKRDTDAGLGTPGDGPGTETPSPGKATKAAELRLPASGRDLTDQLDYADLHAIPYVSGEGDAQLARIWAAQGFDGPPRVVDDAEWERLVEQGGRPIRRGVRGWKSGPSADDIVERYTSGEHYPGIGIFGNGSYFTDSEATGAKYGTGEAYGRLVSSRPEDFSGSAVIEAMLLPDARVVDFWELKRLGAELGVPDGFTGVTDPRLLVLGDPGRLAAALGYDAVIIPTDAGTVDYGNEVLVLNRTATAVRRKRESGTVSPVGRDPRSAPSGDGRTPRGDRVGAAGGVVGPVAGESPGTAGGDRKPRGPTKVKSAKSAAKKAAPAVPTTSVAEARTTAHLREIAKAHNVRIPSKYRTKEAIREYLLTQLGG